MQFLRILCISVGVLAINTIAATVPVSNGTTTKIKRRGNGSFMSWMNSIPPRGKPYCSPTGEGSCNIAFVTTGRYSSLFGKGMTHRTDVYVYNKNCDEIGSIKSVMRNYRIKSELPWEVSGDAHRETFSYFTKKAHGAMYSDCIEYYTKDENRYHVTQCGFDCWVGCYRHGAGAPPGSPPCNQSEMWHKSVDDP